MSSCNVYLFHPPVESVLAPDPEPDGGLVGHGAVVHRSRPPGRDEVEGARLGLPPDGVGGPTENGAQIHLTLYMN